MQFFKVVTMETEEDEFDDGSYSCFELLSLERNLESFYEGRLNHLDLWYHRPVKKTNKKKGNYRIYSAIRRGFPFSRMTTNN